MLVKKWIVVRKTMGKRLCWSWMWCVGSLSPFSTATFEVDTESRYHHVCYHLVDPLSILSSLSVAEWLDGTLLLLVSGKLYRSQGNLGRTQVWHHSLAHRSWQMGTLLPPNESQSLYSGIGKCFLSSDVFLAPPFCLLLQFLPQPVQLPFPLAGMFLL